MFYGRQRTEKLYAGYKDIEINGCLVGIGQPEALKHKLSGWYSRHIDDYHRLVYRMPDENSLEISQCKNHYDD